MALARSSAAPESAVQQAINALNAVKDEDEISKASTLREVSQNLKTFEKRNPGALPPAALSPINTVVDRYEGGITLNKGVTEPEFGALLSALKGVEKKSDGGRRRRGKTAKKVRKTRSRVGKGRRVTRRKLRGGEGFLAAAKGKLGEYGSRVREGAQGLTEKGKAAVETLRGRAEDIAGDARETVARTYGKAAAVLQYADASYNADPDSTWLLRDVEQYVLSKEFQTLKKTDPPAGTLVKLNFTKPHYSLPAWNRMIDSLYKNLVRVRDLLPTDPEITDPAEARAAVVKDVEDSFEMMRDLARKGAVRNDAPDLPYHDVSNVEMVISKLKELKANAKAEREKAREAQRAAEEEAERNAPRSTGTRNSDNFGKAQVVRDVGSWLLG